MKHLAPGRGLGPFLASALLSLAFAASATAATITEYEIEPGAAPGVHVPHYVTTGPDGNLWYTEAGSKPGIGRISPSGERFPQIVDSHRPEDLVFAGDGTLFWTSGQGVGRRLPTGVVEPPPSSTTGPSYGIALTGSGSLRWGEISSLGRGTYCRFASTGFPKSSCWPPEQRVGRLTGMLLGPGGDMWTAWPEQNLLRLYAGEETLPVKVIQLPEGTRPMRLALDRNGDVWVTMAGTSTVGRIFADGTRDAPIPLPPGSVPTDIVLGPDGDLWITELGTGKIAHVTTAGQVTEYPIPSSGSEPMGLTVGPDHAIWFAESGTGRIGRLVPDVVAGPGGGAGGDAGTGGGSSPGDGAGGNRPAVAAPRFTVAPAFAPRRFAVSGGGRAPGRAKRVKKGSKLRLSLSQSATVTATIFRVADGRRTGKRCRAPGAAPRGSARCKRQIRLGRRSWSASRGASKLPFSGRVGGKALEPGTYTATITARHGAGRASAPASAPFTIIADRRHRERP